MNPNTSEQTHHSLSSPTPEIGNAYVPGPEMQPPASLGFAPSLPPAGATTPSVPTPTVATAAPTPPVPNPAATTTPAIADDGDLIEKEWIAKVKQIVEQTENDPYEQARAMNHLRADYLKKRYNKDLKLTDG